MSTETVCLLTPEIVLIAAAVAIYLGGAFSAARRPWSWIAVCAIVLAGVALWMQHGPTASGKPLVLDSLAWHARWLALALPCCWCLLNSRPLSDRQRAGKRGLAAAGRGRADVGERGGRSGAAVRQPGIDLDSDLRIALPRTPRRSEPGVGRQILLSERAGFLDSALRIQFSLRDQRLDRACRCTRRIGRARTACPAGFTPLAELALVLVFAGLCFKITAVPFHFYAPDVYQGTTHPNAALLSVIPKAAGLVAMVRLLVLSMPSLEPYSWRIALILSVLTMTFGNVMALWQDDLRRLLAYSAIAHGGYMLMGLSVGLAVPLGAGGWNGIAAMWFYLTTYAAATIGVFAALESLGRSDHRIDAVDELAGMAHTRPMAAAVMAVFMFSLAGIPLLAGFWGKFFLFGSALNVGGAGLRPWFIAWRWLAC